MCCGFLKTLLHFWDTIFNPICLIISSSFLADRMRDGGDSDEEKDKGHWGKDANMQNKNNLGNHRRGMPSNTGVLQQPGPTGPSKGGNDARRGRQNEDRQDRRVPYAGSNRDTGYQPHSGQSNYPKPANSRGHFDANSRYYDKLIANAHERILI